MLAQLRESKLTAMWPAFVLHDRLDMPEGMNDRLFDVCRNYNLAHRVTDDSAVESIGSSKNHMGHVRANLFIDHADNADIRRLATIADSTARKYLRCVYGYEHTGEISMMADVLYQRESQFENVGIAAHAHPRCDIAIVYYVRTDLHDDVPAETGCHSGELRFYDPAGKGKRFWPHHRQENYRIAGWHSETPGNGSIVAFEGYVPHDSVYFHGPERMCIPILCDVHTEKEHCKANLSEILKVAGSA